MSKPIVVIDYHKGNLSSVARGLARAGAACVRVSDEAATIREAAGLVLPGVGSFYDAITFMHEVGQDQAVLDAVADGVPFLGICLGMQLLFARGNEDVPADAATIVEPGAGAAEVDAAASAPAAPVAATPVPATLTGGPAGSWVTGLGILPGSCVRLESERLKVPHVGWDQLHITEAGTSCPLLKGVPEGANVYFTHSYVVGADAISSQVVARTHYVESFPSVVWENNVFGCQFHPEKSSGTGLAILRNYVSIVGGGLQ